MIDANLLNELRIGHTDRDDGGEAPRWPALLFNGYAASTMAAGSVGKLSFELHVTAGVLWQGLKWALAIGFIGGLFPAVRAATMPVTSALREL